MIDSLTMANLNKYKNFGILLALPLLGSGFMTAQDELPNAPTLTTPITEVSGVKENYVRFGEGYFPYMGGVYQYGEDTEPSPATIVFGSNNKVYFKDIMDFGWDCYTEGTRDGNKITVKLPQTIFVEEYEWAEEPYYQNLCVMTQKGQGDSLVFSYDPSITEVTYTIDDKNNIFLDPLPEGKALGITTYFIGKIYDNSDDEDAENDNYELGWISAWSGAADFSQSFYPLGQELIEWPEGLTPTQYHVVINGYNYPVNIGFQNDYMYIQGLGDSSYIDNFVVRADVKGNTVSIPQNQYVGVFSWDNEMIVTKCGYKKGNDIIFSDDNVSFDFNWDADAKTLTPVDMDMYFCYAYMILLDPDTNQNGLLFTFFFNNFTIIYQDSFPGVPSNPRNLKYDTSDYEMFGYNSIDFEMLSYSTEGNVILTGDLYYSIYIDGDLVTFEYEPGTEVGEYSKYYLLPEPTTEVPFLFTNDNEFYIWDEIERSVGFYYEGVTTVGVQAIYYCNEVRTVSDIVTLNLETGEVTNIPAEAGVQDVRISGNIVSTEYYDLSGRKVSHPQNGIFIKKATLENGQIITSKVALR